MKFFRRPSNDAGFTLIEVMVATFVMALLSAIGVILMSDTLKARARLEVRANDMQEIELARSVLRSDFMQIADRFVRDAYGEQVRGLFRTVDYSEQGFLLSFVRNGHASPGVDEFGSSLQHVTYVLNDNALIRRSRGRLDAAPDTTLRERVLLRDIQKLQIEYFNGAEWLSQWENAAGASLSSIYPMAVSFDFTSKKFGPLRFVFVTPAGY